MIRELQDEIRRLKKLPRRPDLKRNGLGASGGGDTDGPSSGSSGSGQSQKTDRKGRGPRRRNPYLHRRDVTVGLEGVPAGAVPEGYQDQTVRDIVFHGEEVTYRCKVWQFPASGAATAGGGSGTRAVRPRRQGLDHHAVSPVPVDGGTDCGDAERGRAGHLRASGGRFLNADTGGIVEQQQQVLRVGMETALWLNVDDTGARHKARNGYCTAVGNDSFTHFRSTSSKSRLDFLEHLCAGEEAYTINDDALDYMRKRKLSETVIPRLAVHGKCCFSN